MTIQDQYLETFRQTQETWAELVKSFTNDAQRTLGQPSPLFTSRRPQQVHRPGLRLLGEVPRSQRTVVSEQLVGATVSAGEKVREQVESVNAVIRQNADSVGQALREQADSVTATLESAAAAVREHAAKTYHDLNKAELQEALGRPGSAEDRHRRGAPRAPRRRRPEVDPEGSNPPTGWELG